MQTKMKPLILNQTELLDTIFNKYVDPLFIVDPITFKILSSNLAATDTYGFDNKTFLSMSFADLCIEKDNFSKKEIKERHLKLKHLTKNKIILDVRVSVTSLLLDDKDVFLMFCVVEKESNIHQFLTEGSFFQLPDASALINTNYQIITVNSAFEKLFCYKQNEIYNKNLIELLVKDINIEETYRSIDSNIVEFEDIRYAKNGKPRYVKVFIIPKFLGNEVIGAQVIYRNIIETKLIEQNLKIFQTIVEKHLDGVVIHQEDGTIIWTNQAFSNMFGYTKKELENTNIIILRSDHHEQKFYDILTNQMANQGTWRGEIFNKHKNGSINPYWLQVFSTKDDASGQRRFISSYKDLYGKEMFNQKLLLSLQKDPLTLLYNRTYFIEKVEQLLLEQQEKTHILVFIDLDNFKIYNDENGHLLGDKLLAEFAKRASSFFKKALTARFGGDEFVLFYRLEDNVSKIESEINRFKESLKTKPIMIEEKQYYIGLSFGIAVYPQDGNKVYDLLEISDKKMYLAKKK